jgi:hypothetical protein
LTLVMGLSDDEAQAVVDAAQVQMDLAALGIAPLIPPPPAPVIVGPNGAPDPNAPAQLPPPRF